MTDPNEVRIAGFIILAAMFVVLIGIPAIWQRITNKESK